MTLNSSDLKVKPETCSVLSTMGDSLRIHYTVREKRKLFFFSVILLSPPPGAQSAMCACSAGLWVVYVAPSAPCVRRGTARFESSAADGKLSARACVRAGGRLGFFFFLVHCGDQSFLGSYVCAHRLSLPWRGWDGATRQQSPLPTVGQHPSSTSQALCPRLCQMSTH